MSALATAETEADQRALDRVVTVLSTARLTCDTEAILQVAIAARLAAAGIAAECEVRLDGRNRIDFLTAAGVGIEVKVRGPRRGIWRQVQRYAPFAPVRALVLVSALPMPDIPRVCGGKPYRFVALAKPPEAERRRASALSTPMRTDPHA